MTDWFADYWSIRLDASGESIQVGFYPVFINTPPETSVSESSTDDEEPGPSNLVNSSKARAGGSRISADQNSVSQEMRHGVKRKIKTSGRKGLDHRTVTIMKPDLEDPEHLTKAQAVRLR
ncbi:hypothetical protein M9458_051948 [Cirrhinus mrigala]|uniref:Uncharacterized protein n=1 Tax=Cirrhinus mrigala TaxID=683832 RepID=A0ABD0MQ85_CIRMR